MNALYFITLVDIIIETIHRDSFWWQKFFPILTDFNIFYATLRVAISYFYRGWWRWPSKSNDRWRASTASTLSGDELMKVWRLGSCENFVGKIEEVTWRGKQICYTCITACQCQYVNQIWNAYSFIDSKDMMGLRIKKMDHVTLIPLGVVVIPDLTLDIAYMCTKFDDSSFSSSTDMILLPKNLKWSRDSKLSLLEVVWLWLAGWTYLPNLNFLISTRFEDMKGDTECRKWKVTGNSAFRQSAYELIAVSKYVPISHRLRDILASCLSKIAVLRCLWL